MQAGNSSLSIALMAPACSLAESSCHAVAAQWAVIATCSDEWPEVGTSRGMFLSHHPQR
jgi:hypothetical protein